MGDVGQGAWRVSRTGVAVLLLLAAGEAPAAGDAEEGREVAETWCARCHVVGAARPYGGIDSTPAFFLMSEKLDTSIYRFSARLRSQGRAREGRRLVAVGCDACG
jgi:mono/diheme cytochrome c family protein